MACKARIYASTSKFCNVHEHRWGRALAHARICNDQQEQHVDPSKTLAMMNPMKELKINDIDFVQAWDERGRLLDSLYHSKCHGCAKLEVHYGMAHLKHRLRNTLEELKFSLSDESLELMPEFTARLRLLKTLGYIDNDNVVQLKGHTACAINTASNSSFGELMVTELIYDGVLAPLTPEEAVALLSCFVTQDKDDSEPNLTPALTTAKERLLTWCRSLAAIQHDSGVLDVTEESAVEELKFSLVEVVLEWARGTPFEQICSMTSVLEGGIVRCIVRLNETCREVRDAARLIGDKDLAEKMEKASQMIKRDIVFSASLYVQ